MKDRIGYRMVVDAENSGRIKPGKQIESASIYYMYFSLLAYEKNFFYHIHIFDISNSHLYNNALIFKAILLLNQHPETLVLDWP